MRRFVIVALLAMLASACSSAPVAVTAGEGASESERSGGAMVGFSDLTPEEVVALEAQSVVDLDNPTFTTDVGAADPDQVFSFRASGYDIDDPMAPPRFSVSLSEAGLLVRVEGMSAIDGSESYTSWQLSPTGIETLVSTIEAHSAVFRDGRPFEPIGSNDLAYLLHLFDEPVLSTLPNDGGASVAEQAALRDLAARLFDPSFLGDGIVSGPEPWVPPFLSFSARPGTSEASGPAHVWPLDRPLEQILTAGEESFLCLFDADAAIAWDALVNDGENNLHIDVVDDGVQWTLTYRTQYPGHGLGANDPCQQR